MLRLGKFRILSSMALIALAVLCAPAAAQEAGYQEKLAAYREARALYEQEAEVYWNAVTDKRRTRNAKRRDKLPIGLNDYVLTQPPLYTGPPRPLDPDAPGPPPDERPPIPVIADFLKAAAEHYAFAPQRPASDLDFKRAYARAAAAAGLTREQIVGVYAFETGGNGSYDSQAGVSATRPRAISPAIGYNQLLSTNSVSILAEKGWYILNTLRAKAKTAQGPEKIALERKIEGLKRMIAVARSVPNHWNDHDKLAKTTTPGMGIHAAILDIDIGPLLQVQKLLDSVRFARAKGYTAPLTAAELELMNLTGDGNGFDMVTMPQALREKVPTANFFQQPGYERNPVARRTATVAGLIAHMQGLMTRGAQSPGAKELAAAY
jgi:hypothetical protein